jgi:hypothetical protein
MEVWLGAHNKYIRKLSALTDSSHVENPLTIPCENGGTMKKERKSE